MQTTIGPVQCIVSIQHPANLRTDGRVLSHVYDSIFRAVGVSTLHTVAFVFSLVHFIFITLAFTL